MLTTQGGKHTFQVEGKNNPLRAAVMSRV